MLTPIANVHRHQLPRPGALVVVRLDRSPYRRPARSYTVRGCKRWAQDGPRVFIVESYPLRDGPRFTLGIHTVRLRALDNGERVRVAGHWCEEV